MIKKSVVVYLLALTVIFAGLTGFFGFRWHQLSEEVNRIGFLDITNNSVLNAYNKLNSYNDMRNYTLCCLAITVCFFIAFSVCMVLRIVEKRKGTV